MDDVPVPHQVTRKLAPVLERALRTTPVLLYMLFIWSVSDLPPNRLPAGVDDRIAHFGEYGLLALLMAFALTAFDPSRTSGARLALSGLLCLAWGALDEIHQGWTPGRVPSLKDLAFDALGIAVALAVLATLARRSP